MTETFRIFGSELSPYSVKVRSYFRYKGIPHQWVQRGPAHQDEFQKFAKLPLIPLVITPEQQGMQDSTPILEALEQRFPEPGLQPEDPGLAFVSALLEEYADEWGNKHMFHYRWWREADQRSAGERIAWSVAGEGASPEQIAQISKGVIERMVPRLRFVGSHAATQEQIERSFARLVRLLEVHLAAGRSYLFGERPVLADFGLWGQLYEAYTDPTPGRLIREQAPAITAWIERMLEPEPRGGLETWDTLGPTLEPILREEVAGVFLPWTAANARALASGAEELRVELEGTTFTQQPQKYHAKSFGVLRERYARVEDRGWLDDVLERTGGLPWLR